MCEEIIDMEEAEKIARDYVKKRFDTRKINIAKINIAKINILSTELTEVNGIPIYKVIGKADLTVADWNPTKFFSAQIDAKTKKVVGFVKS